MLNPNRLLIPAAVIALALMTTTGNVRAQNIVRIPVETAQIRLIKEVQLSPEVNGTLLFLAATDEGHVVRSGDVVFKLDDSIIQGQYTLAKDKVTDTEIQFGEIALENATIELGIIREANARTANNPAYTQAEVRQAELEVSKAEATLKKAKEEKHNLENEVQVKASELKQFTVQSQMDGVVTQIHRYPGQNVRPGDPVITVSDISMLRAELLVNYRYAQSISVGDEVEIDITTTESGSLTKPVAENAQPAESRSRGILDDAPALRSGASNLNSPPAPAVEPLPAASLAPARSVPRNERFVGKISYILPKLDDNRRIRVWVNVPNRMDERGRYILKEKVEVRATILGR